MYRAITRRITRRAYGAIGRGDYEAIAGRFAPDGRFQLMGEHALGGERRGPDAVREWFARAGRAFPGFSLEPHDIVVDGWPWDTRIATRFTIHATLPDGREYLNHGMQFLRLRWGRVVDDLLYEDTALLAAELERAGARAAAPAAPAGASDG